MEIKWKLIIIWYSSPKIHKEIFINCVQLFFFCLLFLTTFALQFPQIYSIPTKPGLTLGAASLRPEILREKA